MILPEKEALTLTPVNIRKKPNFDVTAWTVSDLRIEPPISSEVSLLITV
jgi:hypothetical protein